MSGSPRALVIDSDQSMLRYLAEALSTFRPGFRVTTATDLGKAGRWLSVIQPDLIVVRLNAFEPAEFSDWLEENKVDRSRILGIAPKMISSFEVASIVAEPVILPQLLSAARSLRHDGYRHDPSTNSNSAHTVQTRRASQ